MPKKPSRKQIKQAEEVNIWMDEVLEKDTAGNHVGAVRVLFEKFDDLLLSGDFNTVDAIIADSEPKNISTPLIMGILCITKPAAIELHSREQFFKKSWSTIKERGENPSKLIKFFKAKNVSQEKAA